MAENFSDSSDHMLLPINHIRSVQINLQAQLESFHKTSPDANFIETYNVCENVRDKVLNSEDESHLSKIHNNSRKISIASELFISICSVYGYIVDCEFVKIIDGLIQWKKFQYISKRITQKMQLKLRREKYFKKVAQSKLHRDVQDNVITEDLRESPAQRTEAVSEGAVIQEENSLVNEQQSKEAEAAPEGTHTAQINKVLELASESSTRDEISHILGNITELRAESPTDISVLQVPKSHVERQVDSLPAAVPEISIQAPNLQENDEDDISKILQILEGDIVEKDVDERELPETLLETTAVASEAAEKPQPSKDTQIHQSEEEMEDWDLPTLKPVKKTKKHHPVIIDKTITIRDYSERALFLSKNINIERVQVFEGPPKVLQAMSANYIMKSPGFRSSLFQNVRSSKLTNLFERHLKVEKKPYERITIPEMRAIEEPRKGFYKARDNEEIVEDIGGREGLHSILARSDVLTEAALEKSHLENLAVEISPTKVLQRESLAGQPVLRLISPPAAPPDLEKINQVAVPHIPRVQQLQGKSFEPERQTSWFHCTKENPPSTKYREFNYVFEKLEKYWSLFESQGLEKSITLREFFSFEADGNVANFLTVLRVLDKLSIQRKLLLKFENQNILIRPFESPFVSEKQLLLKEKEPIF